MSPFKDTQVEAQVTQARDNVTPASVCVGKKKKGQSSVCVRVCVCVCVFVVCVSVCMLVYFCVDRYSVCARKDLKYVEHLKCVTMELDILRAPC